MATRFMLIHNIFKINQMQVGYPFKKENFLRNPGGNEEDKTRLASSSIQQKQSHHNPVDPFYAYRQGSQQAFVIHPLQRKNKQIADQ